MSSRQRIGPELKHLSYMLGKVFGGILAVIGFGAAVYISTHRTILASGNILPYVLAGLIGLAIFCVSSMLSSKYAKKIEKDGPETESKVKGSAVSWVILLALAAIFIVFVMFMKG